MCYSRRLAAALVCAGLALAASPAFADGCGKASWYRMGKVTASGEAMDANRLAAAHRTLPFGSRVRVDNLANGRSVVVRINDRGPFAGGRIIDLTEGAARRIGMIRAGVANVRVTVVEGRGRVGGRACG